MLLVDGLIQVPIIVILMYIPLLCYLDLKYREIPHWLWVPLIIICAPVVEYLYLIGEYPPFSLIVSLAFVVGFYVMMYQHLIEGADFIFLSVISLFFVVNPYPLPHGIMQPTFYFMLLAMMFVSATVLLVLNWMKGRRLSLIEMMSTWEDGVPFILPISAAFVLAVMFG